MKTARVFALYGPFSFQGTHRNSKERSAFIGYVLPPVLWGLASKKYSTIPFNTSFGDLNNSL